MSATTLEQDAVVLKHQLEADLAAAHSHTDTNLTPDGLAKKRNELARAARDRAAVALDALRTQMSVEADASSAHAAKVRPKLPDGSVLQRKWDQARMQLEAGIPLQRVVSSADADTLAAIKEWAPTWLAAEAQAGKPSGLLATNHDATAVLAQLDNSIDERLLTIGDANTQSAIRSDRAARVAKAGFEQHAAHVSRRVAGTPANPLESAVAAVLAGQAANAGLPSE